jgi:hypothetical protein
MSNESRPQDVHEQPAQDVELDDELTDEQLDDVAGGSGQTLPSSANDLGPDNIQK